MLYVNLQLENGLKKIGPNRWVHARPIFHYRPKSDQYLGLKYLFVGAPNSNTAWPKSKIRQPREIHLFLLTSAGCILDAVAGTPPIPIP